MRYDDFMLSALHIRTIGSTNEVTITRLAGALLLEWNAGCAERRVRDRMLETIALRIMVIDHAFGVPPSTPNPSIWHIEVALAPAPESLWIGVAAAVRDLVAALVP
jgi:hypothetical protein